AGPGHHRRAGGGLPGRHGVGRPEGPGDGDHRRTGARQAGHLRRLHRLFRCRRNHGHLHRAAHLRHQGRHDAHPVGRRDRLRFRAGIGEHRMRQQGGGAGARRRGGDPVRDRRHARPV
ncbi:hypothetical protein MMC34_008624, partial [Xylographa carneopallida]|nr:hypothetical protein [Xylographa carneopallida]